MPGGGVLCIVIARLLHEIEKRCQTRLIDLFDLVAGCSSGSIIASLLVSKQSKISDCAELLALLKQEIPKIFSNPSPFYFFKAKYSGIPLQNVLSQYLGDSVMSDVVKPIVIPTYSLSTSRPRTWSTFQALKNSNFDIPLKDAVLAGCSAPTYFPPANITLRDGTKYEEVDGGIWANVPASLAVSELMTAYPNIERQDIAAILVGTGEAVAQSIKLKNYGVLGWGVELINALLSSSSDWQEQDLRFNVSSAYCIMQPKLPNSLLDLDGWRNVEDLIALTDNFIKENNDLFDRTRDILTDNFVSIPESFSLERRTCLWH